MLSSVLNRDVAIKVNIQIIRVYIKIRKILASKQDILSKFEEVENKLADHDKKLILIFKYLKRLEKVEKENEIRSKIGYKQKNSNKDYK